MEVITRDLSLLYSSNVICNVCLCVKPRGSTFPRLEGPDSLETDEDKECVITLSTSVKSLQERNRINFMRNYLLLIGKHQMVVTSQTTKINKRNTQMSCELAAHYTVHLLVVCLLVLMCACSAGHHETPLEAHVKILEKFPDSFPRNQGNVIPPTTDKKVEEVRTRRGLLCEDLQRTLISPLCHCCCRRGTKVTALPPPCRTPPSRNRA